jgi:hypothetical protein
MDYKKKDGEEPMLDFIDIGSRRERPQYNYNIDSYYRQTLVTTKPKTGDTT